MRTRRLLLTILALTLACATVLASCSGGGSDSGSGGGGGDGGTTAASILEEGVAIAKEATDAATKAQSEIKDDATSSQSSLTFAAVADPGMIRLDSLFDMTQYPFATACVEYFIRWDFAKAEFFSPVATYEVDDDNLGVTFHITPGIMMHNGDELHASDIKASIEAQRRDSGLGWQLDFVDLDASEEIDDYTYDIRFNTINGVWESSFSMFTVISGRAYQECLDKNGSSDEFYRAPVSPAPYIVTDWVDGDHITVTAFEDYHGGKPPIDTMTMKIVSDDTAAYMELQKGEVDLVWNISAENVKKTRGADGLQLLLTDSNIINYVGLNSGNEALSDFRVRQAIYYATNREDINIGAFGGLVYPIYSIMTNEAIGYYDGYETAWPYETDIDKAKALMEEAGYGDGLTLRLLGESTENYKLVSEQLAAMLGEIGITLEIELTDYATQNSILGGGDTGAYDLYLSFSQACDESVATLDNPMLFGMSHPELSADGSAEGLQAIWDEIRVTPDITEREALYVDAQKYFFEKGLYWMPLNETQNYVATKDNLTGLRFNGSLIYFEDAYFK